MTRNVPSCVHVLRGQATRGLGEGPGTPSIFGEQYLSVDVPFLDAERLAQIRTWLTLDARDVDHHALGLKLEAWSAFSVAGYEFAVRLCSNPHFQVHDSRVAYFAHARGWEQRLLTDTFSPGQLIGDPTSFEAPWTDSGRSTTELPPATMPAGFPVLERERDVVERLLAWFFDAQLARLPVLVVAGVQEFKEGGTLAGALGLARLALPRSLRQACALRVYSTNPGYFLTRVGATVVACSERDATEVLRTLPNCLALDRGGEAARGRRPSDPARAYAAEVVAGMARFPAGLIPFTRRIDPLLATERGLSARLARTLPTLFDISFAEMVPEAQEPLIDHLLSEIGMGWSGLPFEQLLPRVDGGIWAGMAADALGRVALTRRVPAPGMPGEPGPGTPGQVIRQLAARELEERRLVLDPVLPAPEACGEAELGLLGWALSLRLASPAAVAARTLRQPLDALLASKYGLGLLNAEIEAAKGGFIAPRRFSASDAERLVGREDGRAPPSPLLRQLIASTAQGALSPGWLLLAPPALLDQPELWELVLAAWEDQRNPQAPAAGWIEVLERGAEALMSLEQPTPGLLFRTEAVAAALPRDQPWLVLTLVEALTRWGSVRVVELSLGLHALLPHILREEDRQRLVSLALDPSWRSLTGAALLDRAGDWTLPSDWLPDVAAQLATSEALMARASVGACVALRGAISPGDSLSAANVDAALEGAIQRAGEAGLLQLVRAGAWASWLRGRLSATSRREAALRWLRAPFWHEPGAPGATWGDWTAAMDALSGTLKASEIEATYSQNQPGWPIIRGRERPQREALYAAAADLGALAALLEHEAPATEAGWRRALECWSDGRPERAAFALGDPGSLSLLCDGFVPEPLERWALEDLIHLADGAGERADRLVRELERPLVGKLLGAQGVRWLQLATRLDLVDRGDLVSRTIERLFQSSSLNGVSPEVLAALNRSAQARPLQTRVRAPELAAELVKRRAVALALMADPDRRERELGLEDLPGICGVCVRALVRDDLHDPAWGRIGLTPAQATERGGDFDTLIAQWNDLCFRLRDAERQQVEQATRDTLPRLLSSRPYLLELAPHAEVIPALSLAAALGGVRGVTAVLRGCLTGNGARRDLSPEWWAALPPTLVACARTLGADPSRLLLWLLADLAPMASFPPTSAARTRLVAATRAQLGARTPQLRPHGAS